MRCMIGSQSSSIHRWSAQDLAGANLRYSISKRGSHAASSTDAFHIERTRTTPRSGPEWHAARMKPRSLASKTDALASSSNSRRSVSSQDSLPSVRPPGKPQRDPSSLTKTISPSAVRQTALAPCGAPSGSSEGGCQTTVQSPPFARTATSSPSDAGISRTIYLASVSTLPIFGSALPFKWSR
jgi:hypothetical protein